MKVGDTVWHQCYGVGTIVAVYPYHAIRYDVSFGGEVVGVRENRLTPYKVPATK